MAKASLQTMITRLRDAFLATNPAGEEGKLSRELDALPLGTAEEFWFFMHPDGRLLAFNLFVNEVTAEFTGERDVAFGLRLGSDRYPELEELLPERVIEAVECKGCLGTGWALESDGSRYACGWCHGRGWSEPRDDAADCGGI